MPKSKAKYTTIAQLSEAFKSGELDDSYSLVMDKGGNSLHLRQDGPEEEEDERFERCAKMFKWEYDSPLEELFKLAGIPCEWC